MIFSALLIAGSLLLLGWTFWRARGAGRVGILAWLQSVLLFAPWLLFLAVLPLGLSPSPLLVILLLVGATGGYIWVGTELRKTIRAQEKDLRDDQKRRLYEGTAGESTLSSVEASSFGRSVDPLPQSISIPEEDLQTIRGLFGIDTFFATESQPFRQGVLFRGNLRGETGLVFETLTSKLRAQFDSRYRLYLLADEENRPAVLVVTEAQDPFQAKRVLWPVAAVLFVATVASLGLMASATLEFDPLVRPDRIPEALPIVAGVLFTLALHEAGHRWQAKRYGVRLSPGFLIPLVSPFPIAQLGFAMLPGSFGSLTRFESPPPNRKALFDIAIAGPALGGLAALFFLIVGLWLSGTTTVVSPLSAKPADLTTWNVLLAGLVQLRWGTLPPGRLILLNPMVLIGMLGLHITALALLPAGQFDGGRIVQAVYGRKTVRITGVVTTIILAAAGIFIPQFLFWAVALFFLGRIPERPALEELTETDTRRDIVAIIALFLMAAILLPFRPTGG